MKPLHLPIFNDPSLRLRLWSILAMFALLLMEATGDSLWYQALFFPRQVGWGTIYLVLFAVLSISILLAHAMERKKWNMLARQLVYTAWIVAAVIISMKLLIYPRTPIPFLEMISMPVRYFVSPNVDDVNFFHLLAIILLVARGAALARAPLTLSEVQFSFQVGLIGLLLYGMVFATIHPREAAIGLYSYLFCGLISMSLARVSTLRELRGGRLPRFGGGWLASVLLAALAVVGLALLAGWLTSGRVVQLLATALVIFFAILTAILLYVLNPLLVYLADLLMNLGDLLAQAFDRLKNAQISEALLGLIEQLNDGLGKIVPYVLAARGLVLVLIVAILVLLIVAGLRLRSLRADLIEEAETSTVEPQADSNPLRNLLRRLLQEGRRLRLRSPEQILAAARIRQIYRQLEQLSKKLGAARPPSTTPLEFLPRLEALLPGEQDGLETITGAYLKVRYGEFPETRSEVTQVEDAWKQVRQAGRRALAVHKTLSKKQK